MSRKTSRRGSSGATIHDVARHAGVSPMTVSRVINAEGNVRDAAHFALAVRHNVIAFALTGRVGAHTLLAEIDVAVEFADDQQVDRRRDLGAQCGAVLQPREQLGWAQIGEQAEFGAQAKNRLFGTQMALDALQLLGGNGYINDYPTGRLLRDAKLYEIGAGTSEIRRWLIGREIMAEGV